MEESSSPSSHYFSIFTNYPLFSAVLAFTIAQFIKFFTTWYKEKRWDLKRLVGSGGMPSSHSATVTALAMAVGLQEGFGGSLFAMAFILTSIVWLIQSLFLSVLMVMYDATGVRLHAGRQAEVFLLFVFSF
ncbi:hypothetical protein F2Q68_00008494, partial [Brassica cretica]